MSRIEGKPGVVGGVAAPETVGTSGSPVVPASSQSLPENEAPGGYAPFFQRNGADPLRGSVFGGRATGAVLAKSLGVNLSEVAGDGPLQANFDDSTQAVLDTHGHLLELSPQDPLSSGDADILINQFLGSTAA